MNRIAYPLVLAAVLIPLAISCLNDTKHENPWPAITGETRPWTRWWWMGSAVDRENITALMEEYADAGIGGVEITPIYGARGYEDRYLDFLSAEWMDMLKTTVAEAGRLGMGVDMNLGTGWPFGGPQITPGYAASMLIVREYKLTGNDRQGIKILPGDPRQQELGAGLEALMAYSDNGEILDLTDRVGEDGSLDWSPVTGEWELFAVFCGKTRQQVKRAAPGGQGFTLNHFSESALEAYLERFEEAFAGSRGVRCFFNDSYEVYHASWTPGFFDAFLARRGYDLREYIRELTGESEDEMTARLKSDYRQTLSELLLENFTLPWTRWSNDMGSLTRNQAHGSPGNLIDLYAAVDIPECEIFGHCNFDIPGLPENEDDTQNVEPNPMMLKLATSAAHVSNKKRISNETFTWLGEHFKVALSQCKPEVEEAFLAGINHVFYHGTTYSPADAPWPGWLFYASVHFGPTNSFWSHLPGLNQYITRCQSILQSGKPDNEVLVYWPVFDIWHDARGLEKQLTVHGIREWLHYPGIERMAEHGYSYDFISDALLQEVEPADGRLRTAGGEMAYEVLVVPACGHMPLASLEKVIELAEAGSRVVFQELPADVPGLHELEERREQFDGILGGLQFQDAGNGVREYKTGNGSILLCGEIEKALEYAGIPGESIRDLGLKFTRRVLKDGKYYYLVNHSSGAIDAMVPLNAPAGTVLILDPQDGSYGKAFVEPGEERVRVRVQLRPGRAVFLRTLSSGTVEADEWAYEEGRLEPVELGGTWNLAFTGGGPEMPRARELEALLPWTGLGDSILLDFSGTAEYTLDFDLPELAADEYILDLGQVHSSARVWLNGKDLDIFWSVPFERKVGDCLKEGENKLKIEVANLMANRIRYMDRQGIPWRVFHEINFVNILYRPFDASGWEVSPSGLEGPVRLIPVDTGRTEHQP